MYLCVDEFSALHVHVNFKLGMGHKGGEEKGMKLHVCEGAWGREEEGRVLFALLWPISSVCLFPSFSVCVCLFSWSVGVKLVFSSMDGSGGSREEEGGRGKGSVNDVKG